MFLFCLLDDRIALPSSVCLFFVKENSSLLLKQLLPELLKLNNYSCSSYPTSASYSGQVDEFRNPMKNELKTRLWKKPVSETISNTGFIQLFELVFHWLSKLIQIFVICILIKQQKTRGDKQLYLITHFTKQTLNPNYDYKVRQRKSRTIKVVNRSEEKVRVHMNVVPRSTMNTNGETEN